MTGADEGDDVGADVGFRQAAAGFRILRREQQRQQIARRLAAALEQRLAAFDDGVDRVVEEPERGAAARSAEPRQERRRADEIERIEASEAVEIARHGALEFARLAPEPLREQRLLQHFERHARHEFADVGHRAVAATAEPLDRRLGDPLHGGREVGDLARRKQRRERPPLQAPRLALGRQQAVAEARD